MVLFGNFFNGNAFKGKDASFKVGKKYNQNQMVQYALSKER